LADSADDQRWLAAAASLAARGRPLSRPNPAVGAILVKDGKVVARGWTRPGGRPHAEAVALAEAGDRAKGATLYVSLEPCAHASERGPACADLVAASGAARVVVGCGDPDPRTAGAGIARIRLAGTAVELASNSYCASSLAGHLARNRLGRPHVTLKLALSEDCRLARPPGESQWLTGEEARAHVHAWRAKMDAILIGGGTLRADRPRLDVRLPGIESRSPERWLLTRGAAPEGWKAIPDPQAISAMEGVQWLMVEGGAETARSFLAAGLVDRLMLYRAPLSIGSDQSDLPNLSPTALAGNVRWQLVDRRALGNDIFEDYHRIPCSPE
jgi:diaminohydroxyphosphoribosylaminopyrimidine deaminase/5-amino-6-(5-phosphoribosylamino)uracil reductase